MKKIFFYLLLIKLNGACGTNLRSTAFDMMPPGTNFVGDYDNCPTRTATPSIDHEQLSGGSTPEGIKCICCNLCNRHNVVWEKPVPERWKRVASVVCCGLGVSLLGTAGYYYHAQSNLAASLGTFFGAIACCVDPLIAQGHTTWQVVKSTDTICSQCLSSCSNAMNNIHCKERFAWCNTIFCAYCKDCTTGCQQVNR